MNMSLGNGHKGAAVLKKDRGVGFRIILAALGFLILSSVIFLFRYNDIASSSIQAMLATAHADGAWRGWIACELIQIVVALCGILPASATAMGIGAAYGIMDGFLLAAPATMIGALISFVLSRTFLRGLIHRFVCKRTRLDRLDQVLSAEGWKIACLFRLSPIMPFSITSYALGMSSLSIKAYTIGTLASLPALLGYITMGALTARSLTSVTGESISWVHAGILILGVVGTFALIWHLTRVITKVLSRAD